VGAWRRAFCGAPARPEDVAALVLLDAFEDDSARSRHRRGMAYRGAGVVRAFARVG
jgi:hypothetical protein